MVQRLLVVFLFVSGLVMVPAGVATACSCAPLQPAQALGEFDAAFVGRLVERPSSGGQYQEAAPYVFEVETWVKDDLGAEIIVYAPNQGSACGFEVPVGKRIGVFVTIQGEKAYGGLCTTVDADLLLAGDQLYSVDGTGPPVFLVAGWDGPARLMLLDAAGGLLATVGEEGETVHAVNMCPGAETLVEMVNDQLVVRRTSDLSELRRVDLDGLPYRRGVSRIWCRDVAGETLWLPVEDWAEDTGTWMQLVDAADLETPLLEGAYMWLEVGAEHAVAFEAPSGERVWRIDLGTGESSLLHEVPVEAGDSPPMGRGWMDPQGDRVMITQWRHSDGTGGKTVLFLYEVSTGELLWQSDVLPTADGVGWIDDSTFVIGSWPEPEHDREEYGLINVEDPQNPVITTMDESPGWQTFRVGEALAGVSGGRLQTVPIAGGPPADLRLLPSESHRLIAVLDSEAIVTPTTVVTTPPPTTDPQALPGPASLPGDESSVPWGWLFGGAIVLALLPLSVVGARRFLRT